MAGRIARLIRCSEDADNAAIEPCACNLMSAFYVVSCANALHYLHCNVVSFWRM